MAVWIICGVAGSGKTSLAKALAESRSLPWLEADDFHPQANIKKMSSGQALDEGDREAWLAGIESALKARKGESLILAFPGLKAIHRARVAAAAGSARFLFLKVSPETARQRLQDRGGFFPPALIRSQFQTLEEPAEALILDAEEARQELFRSALAWMEAGAVGVIGLGRIGLGLARRLERAGFSVGGYDILPEARARAADGGFNAATTLESLVASLPRPRRLLMSLPAGEATSSTLEVLAPLLAPGDLVIDAANALWKDSQKRGAEHEAREVHFVDAGVSGGVLGAGLGYCVMAGGSPTAYGLAQPILSALAAPRALLHCGPSGSGHFVKMVHNGVEYAMMQSYAEGFELMKRWPGARLPLPEIADLWNHGAVIRSWLLELAAEALAESPELSKFTGKVGEMGTGRWGGAAAQELGVEVPAMRAALEARSRSREKPGFGSKLLSALRAKFGGHKEAA